MQGNVNSYSRKMDELTENPQIYTNLEMIKSSIWIGLYGENFKKVGKWFATWKGKIQLGQEGTIHLMEKNKVYGKNLQSIIGMRQKFMREEHI
ncbi:unnamed protein product [Paramecium octaurelia]|uniref:Uncharacterized protein n=1 Tax=Paramecium octaurelia TaxID=43137 RepID=A0A8S1Y941_PAROT|nr:unnamed protein product [Paramecium octaurelia]